MTNSNEAEHLDSASDDHVFDQTNGLVDLGKDEPQDDEPKIEARNRRRMESSKNIMMIGYGGR